jgi:PAS domain S-box-containing protein
MRGRPFPASSVLRLILMGPAFLFLCLTALALDPNKKITQYVHNAWTSEQGLPENDVRSIVQTRDGYLWLATEEGLARFDGVHFRVFDKHSIDAIKNNFILSLFEDREGTLWIGSWGGGLVRFSRGRFEAYGESDGLSDDIVNVITQDRDGNIWIGTGEGGVNVWKDGKFTAYTTKQGLSHDRVHALCPSHDGSLWIGSDGGLDHLRDGKITSLQQPEDLKKNGVFALYEDERGVLWIGSNHGLYSYKDGTFTLIKQIPRSNVSAIYQDRNHSLFVGTEGGLYRLRQGKIESYTVRDGLTAPSVSSIFEDREGSLWIGTVFGGLDRLRDGKFATYTTHEGLANNAATAILQTKTGDVWIGTLGGGLSKFSKGRFETFGRKHGLASDKVMTLAEGRDGGLWVGTMSGLNYLKNGTITSFAGRYRLPHALVTAVLEDSRGGVWIGTETALYKLQDGALTTFTTAQGLSSSYVVCLFEDDRGNMWIGTDQGINLYRDGQFRDFVGRKAFADDFITQIRQQAPNTLWVTTQTSGIKSIRDGKVTSISRQNGLPHDTIWNLLFDNRGDAWISSNKGIFRVSQQELQDLAADKIRAVHPIVYGMADGMKSNECNGAQPAGWRMTDAKLWFPTTKGIVVIDPEHVTTNVHAPQVYIEEVIVKGRPVAGDEAASLPSGSRNMEIRYTGLSFLVPEKVIFRYMLEGFDKTWIEAGTRRTAYYSYLPAGKYTFRVTAANNDGVWNQTGSSYTFNIRPAFYETYWFYLLSVLAVVLLVRAIYRRNVQRLKRRTEELAVLSDALAGKLEAEGRYHDLFESAVDAIYRARGRRYLEVNRAMVTMLGYTSKEEILALTQDSEVYTDVKDLDRVISVLDAAGKVEGFETVWKRQDGRLIQVRLSGRRIADAQGGADTYEVIAQDVTERKHLEEQLRQSQKMEAIGRLAGGMAHDFNNLLTVILGYTRIVLSRDQKDSLTELYQVQAAADHAAALTGQLLAFSRQQVLQPRVMDLNAIVRNVEAMLGRVIGEDIEVSTDLEPTLWLIKADRNQIAQVMLNLAVNARDAMPKGGRLRFVTRNLNGENGNQDQANAPSGPHVVLEVSDTGQGMDNETLAHIFEPFFTTKDIGEGTGLGLSTVYGIVQQSGGHVQVQSQPGRGTTFRIYLPRVWETEVPEEAPVAPSQKVAGHETILLVEDHAALRSLTATILEGNGYKVLQAGSPDEAERICHEYSSPIDMILTDVIMPGDNGPALARRLQQQRPGIRLMYVSGYVENPALREEVLDHNLPFLQKPFGPAELLSKVRQVLDSSLLHVRRLA